MRTRDRVLALREQGRSLNQIAGDLGITKSTVCYHLRRLGEPPDERFNRRYDWAAVQEYYDAGHSITACQARFGFSRETWNAARRAATWCRVRRRCRSSSSSWAYATGRT